MKIYEKTGGIVQILPDFKEYATGGQEKTICVFLKYPLGESKLSMGAFQNCRNFFAL